MSSSLSFAANAFIVVLPFCLTPSFMALVASASVNEACTCALVRSLAFNCLPILVLALPSAPWHCAQFASHKAFGLAAYTDAATILAKVITLMVILFMSVLSYVKLRCGSVLLWSDKGQ